MISSRSNEKIKNIIRLQKASERRQQQLVVVEGHREIERALIAGWSIQYLFYYQELAARHLPALSKLLNQDCHLEEVSREVFDHIAYREGSDGMLALFRPVFLQLEQIRLPRQPLIVVIEGVEKPGNLGAILRTTDAAGVDAVLVCDPATDLYNPNTIRASLGCIFRQQVVAADSQSVINWLKKNAVSIYCTALTASKNYLDADYTGASALVMGTEATGLSQQWLAASNQNIRIPMQGIADSLNVSVTTAIVVYEALRQRRNIR